MLAIKILIIAVLGWIALTVTCLAFATDRHQHDPVPVPVSQSSPNTDRKADNLYGAMVVSGLASAALRDERYGAYKSFGGTVVGAAIIEAAHSGSYNGKNVWYAAGGAAVGSVGTCLIFFRKGFVGCGFEFK